MRLDKRKLDKWSVHTGKFSLTRKNLSRKTCPCVRGFTLHILFCCSKVPDKDRGKCKDIALQLIEKGKDINVVFGGGRSKFLPKNMTDPELTGEYGKRTDGRNLIRVRDLAVFSSKFQSIAATGVR